MSMNHIEGDVLSGCLDPSTCEACGEPFTCDAGLGRCWCAEIKLSLAALAVLRGKYKSCLCSKCLREFAQDAVDKSGSLSR